MRKKKITKQLQIKTSKYTLISLNSKIIYGEIFIQSEMKIFIAVSVISKYVEKNILKDIQENIILKRNYGVFNVLDHISV